MSGITIKPKVKRIKTVCRCCGKARKFLNMELTSCCFNWICDDFMDYGKIVCHSNHRKYSCCYLHFRQEHEGKWQDCEKCLAEGDTKFDFDEITCATCGFKSEKITKFKYQLNGNFYCEKEECLAKVQPPPPARERKKNVVKEVKKACRDCGKISKLTKTSCCNNWICDDANKYVMFSYALNSCYRNHHRYSLCSSHHNERHEGRWQDCEKCKKSWNSVGPEFDDVTCVSCGLKSVTMVKFAFQINGDFYCKKDDCLRKCKQVLDGMKWAPKRKAEEDQEGKKAKRACGICGRAMKLTKTECCDNWVCDKLFFSGCVVKHKDYSHCAFHHSQGHEGNVHNCERCKERGCFKFDFDDFEIDSLKFEQYNTSEKNISEN